MEDFNLSDLRILIKKISDDFNPDEFLSDSEVNNFESLSKESDDPNFSLWVSGIDINSALVEKQEYVYNRLSVYIKLLQCLAKFRPLPF